MLGDSYFDDDESPKLSVQTFQKIVEDKLNNKKQTTKKNKKQKHENIMKTLPPSCFSCSTHSPDNLRLIHEPSPVRPTCKSCGFKLNGKLGYLVCPKVASCFVLCSTCKVCTSNHFLRKMLTLKHLNDNELYAKDKFKCHSCRKEKQVDGMKGVWHCNVCSFSICWECMQKTEALWQDKNVSSDEDESN